MDLPPGMVKPGTVYQARGRWYDGNLVRWFNGVLQAWGGWQQVTVSGDPVDLGGTAHGMYAWRRNNGAPVLALGTRDKLWVLGGSSLVDATPGGFVAGQDDATQTTGAFGRGAFGRGPFGVGDLTADYILPAQVWQFDNWGEDLLAWAGSDRKIYRYRAALGTTEVLAGAPTNNAGVLVTPENSVVALGPDGAPRAVRWADPDDPEAWLPDIGNLAGDLLLRSEGRIVAGRATSREVLIWTDVDVHTMRFVGGEYVYGVQVLGRASLMGSRAIAVFDDKAVWMGKRGFSAYDGEIRPMHLEVADYVFSDFNYGQASKVFAVPLHEYQEVIWFYPSSRSRHCDRYVAYNWLGGWSYVGQLERCAAVDVGVFPYPLMADHLGKLYRHELVSEYGRLSPSGQSLTPYVESGPWEIGAGDRVMHITRYIPDEKTLGSVDLELITSFYPTGPESVVSGLTASETTPVRATGRQVRLRLREAVPGWRVGTLRLDVTPGGLR